VVKRIDQLEHAVNPLDIGKWLDGNLKGSLSTRVGKIRVVFKVVHERKQIEVQRIQYRGKDYKP
jgi:mRNA-degrading endonuclease RelE of RelBE toxin-antitoxin system